LIGRLLLCIVTTFKLVIVNLLLQIAYQKKNPMTSAQ